MNRTHQPLIAHTPGWNAAVTVGILGWVLDAFDFFVVIFLLTELAAKRANQQRPTVTKIPRTLWSHAGIFGYLLLVMTAMTVSPTARRISIFWFGPEQRGKLLA